MSTRRARAALVVVAWLTLFEPSFAAAQGAAINGRGTYGTTTFSYICPSIAVLSHGLIAFTLQVSSNGTGTLQATCMGFNSHIDSIPITAILEITDTRAWVRGIYDLEGAGYAHCVDRAGTAMSRIAWDIRVQAGSVGTVPPPTIHISSAVPPGGISCRDPDSNETVVFQNFDSGVQPLASGSINVTQHPRTTSN